MSDYTSPPPPGAGGPPPVLTGPRVLAGWWSRAGAALVDGVIVGLGAAVLLVAISAPLSIDFFRDDAGFISTLVDLVIAIACVSIVACLYAPALMARTNGRTFGRMATGIRVVRASGKPIGFWFAMLREVVVKSLLFGFLGTLIAGLVPLVDVLWPLWDEENRALHDYVVNTRVVRT